MPSPEEKRRLIDDAIAAARGITAHHVRDMAQVEIDLRQHVDNMAATIAELQERWRTLELMVTAYREGTAPQGDDADDLRSAQRATVDFVLAVMHGAYQ
jgi:SMC interacting uncharacterized protein involved in chromosome segregation